MKVPIKDIVFDDSIYPRQNYYWQIAYDYSLAIKSGSKFPPITLGKFKNKLYLIDGKHRLEATKSNKQKLISAKILTGLSKEEMFSKAVNMNNLHGQRFSVGDKVKIIVTLRNFKMDDNLISKLVHMPVSRIESMIEKRVTSSITGQQIILKPSIKHLVHQDNIPENIDDIQTYFKSNTQYQLIKELTELLKNKLIDKDNKKVMNLLIDLNRHLKYYV